MELLLSKTPPEDVRAHLLPLIYGALESANIKAQELVLEIVPTIAHLIDNQLLMPKLMKVVTESQAVTVRFFCS